MAEGFEGLDRVLRRVGQIATNVRHVERPLNQAGEYIVGSVKRNFFAGGRPQRWTPLAPSTLKRRRKGRSRQRGAIPLTDFGHLRDSVTKKVTTDGVRVGTGKVQARRQHFGYPGGSGPGHAHTPARPYMLLQDEDIRKIGGLFVGHVARK